MRRWWFVWTGALVLVSVTVSVGARATDLLDPLEGALEQRLVVEQGLPQPQKRVVKAIQKTLRKLDKETTSTAGDVKLLKKVTSTVSKKLSDDAAVASALDDAVENTDDGVQDVVGQARALVNAAEEGKKRRRAEKAVGAAQRKLDKTRTKTTVTSRVAGLLGARKKADKALRLADGLPPAQMGGGEFPELSYIVAQDGVGDMRIFEVRDSDGERTRVDIGAGPVAFQERFGPRAPSPVESPDLGAIAFVQDDVVVIAEILDTPEIRTGSTTSTWRFLRWSPDGQMLAAGGESPDVVQVVARDGTVLHTIDTAPRGGLTNAFTWSRDGHYLGVRTSFDADFAAELVVLDLNTGAVTDISETEKLGDSIDAPAWSPSNDHVAYIADENGDGDAELVVSSPDGSQKTTVSAAGEIVEAFRARSMSWTADGSRVVYMVRPAGGGRGVASVRPDGQGHMDLGAGDAVTQIAVAPAEDRVAFLADGELTVVDADGTDELTFLSDGIDFVWARPLAAAAATAAKPRVATVDEPTDDALLLRELSSAGGRADLFLLRPGETSLERISGDLPNRNAGSPPVVAYYGRECAIAAYVARTPEANFDSLLFGSIADSSGGAHLQAAAAAALADDVRIKVRQYTGTQAFGVSFATYDSISNSWRRCSSTIRIDKTTGEAVLLAGPRYVDISGEDFQELCTSFREGALKRAR